MAKTGIVAQKGWNSPLSLLVESFPGGVASLPGYDLGIFQVQDEAPNWLLCSSGRCPVGAASSMGVPAWEARARIWPRCCRPTAVSSLLSQTRAGIDCSGKTCSALATMGKSCQCALISGAMPQPGPSPLMSFSLTPPVREQYAQSRYVLLDRPVRDPGHDPAVDPRMAFAFAVTIPVLLYQLWMFVVVGLKQKERSLGFLFIPGAVIFFYIGIVAGYFFGLPWFYAWMIHSPRSIPPSAPSTCGSRPTSASSSRGPCASAW